MLIRTSGLLHPGLHLLTLGHTCRYVLGSGALTLTDPGASLHVELLPERFQSVGLRISDISAVVLTHLDPDRAAGIPRLRELAPKMRLLATGAQTARLTDPIVIESLYTYDLAHRREGAPPPLSQEAFGAALVPDKVVTESDQIACSDGISLRVAALPGHTAESLGFIVEPHSFLIGDEVLGYYKGRELAAPGCDDSIERSLETLGKIEKLALGGLGLPYFGALSGELIRRHLRAVIENTTDLVREVRAAVVSGVPRTVIEQNILDAFYRTESRDPCVLEGLERTFQNIKRQLLATN